MYANVSLDDYTKIRMALKNSKRTSGDLVGILVHLAIMEGYLDDVMTYDEVERLKRQYGDAWPKLVRAIKAEETATG